MGRLDHLVGEVKDSKLREQLRFALADMKRKQKFGLVFEEHIPETNGITGNVHPSRLFGSATGQGRKRSF